LVQQRIAKISGVILTIALMVGVSAAKTRHHEGSTTTKKVSSKASSHTASSKAKSVHTSKASSKSAKSSSGKRGKKSSARSRKPRGQQAIDSDRTREIQEALIREHYLDGAANGSFDQRTKSALQKFQQDNGWQSKVVPDSRALIKLGLGPSHDGLLNPESAAVGSALELGSEREIPGGSIAPAQRNK